MLMTVCGTMGTLNTCMFLVCISDLESNDDENMLVAGFDRLCQQQHISASEH